MVDKNELQKLINKFEEEIAIHMEYGTNDNYKIGLSHALAIAYETMLGIKYGQAN